MTLPGCARLRVATVCLVLAAPVATATAGRQAEDRGITLIAEGTSEEWHLQVKPLAAKDGQPPSHAVVLASFVKACDTPRAFAIVFTIGDGPDVRKQGGLLSRQKQADGSCVDAIATVFPVGTAPAFATATAASIGLPGRRLVLSTADIAYLARELATPPPGDTSTTAMLQGKAAPLPADPAARALADESTRLNEQAIQLYRAGRLRDARKAAEGSVAAAEKAWGPAHGEVAGSLVNLGLIVRKLGDNKAAATHYRRAVTILEKEAPSEALGVVLDNLGHVHQDLGDLDAAMTVTRRAIEVLTAVVGPRNEHVGFATNNLALILSAKGEDAQAAETCDRAIAILQQALGPDHPTLTPFLEDQRKLRKRARR
jgi:Tfp pilus assembly protein PilF